MSGRTSTDGAAACGDAFTQPVPQSTLPNMPGCYKGGRWGLDTRPLRLSAATRQHDGVLGDARDHARHDPHVPGAGPRWRARRRGFLRRSDESWYLVWAQQPANGTDYLTTKMEGKTTVRLGVTDLVLAPLPCPRAGHVSEPRRSPVPTIPRGRTSVCRWGLELRLETAGAQEPLQRKPCVSTGASAGGRPTACRAGAKRSPSPTRTAS